MDLRFNGSAGRQPEPGTKEALFLAACCAEDRQVWREVAAMQPWEIYEAIDNLRRLGWGFELVTLQ